MIARYILHSPRFTSCATTACFVYLSTSTLFSSSLALARCLASSSVLGSVKVVRCQYDAVMATGDTDCKVALNPPTTRLTSSLESPIARLVAERSVNVCRVREEVDPFATVRSGKVGVVTLEILDDSSRVFLRTRQNLLALAVLT